MPGCVIWGRGGGGGGPRRLKVFPAHSERIVLVGDVSIFFPFLFFLEQFLFQNSRMMIYKVNF